MWKLYLGYAAQDPGEVARICLVKAGLMLERRVIYPGSPLAIAESVLRELLSCSSLVRHRASSRAEQKGMRS